MEILCSFEDDCYNDKNSRIKFGESEKQYSFDAQTSTTTTAKPKFYPPQQTELATTGRFTTYEQTKQQCITFMQEYADKSIEELRVADYAANLKGPQAENTTASIESQPSNSVSVFTSLTSLLGQHVQDKSPINPFSRYSPTNTSTSIFPSGDSKYLKPTIIQMPTNTSLNPFEKTSAFYNFASAPKSFEPQSQNLANNIFSFGQSNSSLSTTTEQPTVNKASCFSSIFGASSSGKQHGSTQELENKTDGLLRGDKVFTCKVENQLISEDQELKFIGQYKDGKTNDDVIFVKFNKCTLTKVPQGLTKIFPNMKVLWIMSSKLKNICKDDLVEYKNLVGFRFDYNEIEFLPQDLFEDFRNLMMIEFWGNDLKIIEPNILDGLYKLELVDFRKNLMSTKKYYSFHPDLHENGKIEDVKFELFENYPKKYEIFEKLRVKIQQLQDFNLKLKSELEHKNLENSNITVKIQTGFLGDFKTFIKDEATKDFKILTDDQEFSVHKFLLAARSPTLAELLKNNPEVESLKLLDISVETFEIILKFLYTDELPGDDGTNFLQLFAAAGKLKIEELKNFAAKMLIDQVNHGNAVEIFKLSNSYQCDELRQKAFNEVKKCYSNYKLKDEWITKPEIVVKAIEQFKRNEEALRKLEEEFENSTFDD